MTGPKAANVPNSDRMKANRLRKLRDNVRGMGKRSLVGMLDAGEALEEAAGILRGQYSTWVLAECQIDARTALGYRKTFRVLNHRREWLIKKRVSPSVALTIACAKPEGRERALAALAAERTLSVADAKAIVCEPGRRNAPELASAALSGILRAFTANFLEEVDRIVAMAGNAEADEFGRMELAVRARVLMPMLKALGSRTAGGPNPPSHQVFDALAQLARATSLAEIDEAGSALVSATQPGDGVKGSVVPVTPSPTENAPIPGSSGIRSIASTYSHGLTTLEICAGAGGQAAGLSKAGFRHLALVEKSPAACETLRSAFGADHVVQTDLVGYKPVDIGPVDLLAGGVPCQPFSKAGKRKGAQDDRDLFPEALRLVELLRPRAVMLENVMGLLEPSNDLHRFDILSKLRRLGYSAEWRGVDASHFGVPQMRRRAVLVAFRERDAMRRFRWPQATLHYAEEPHPVVAALDGHLRAGGWMPTAELQDRMDRAAPTIIGGSDKKQGIDFGKRKSAAVWSEMGFVQTRIGKAAPFAEHEGDVEVTLPMLATLQGFPHDWPFRGSRKEVFRQIANAFPPAVALHLGCAIASALTGTEFDPSEQDSFEGMRWIHLPRTQSADGPAAPRHPEKQQSGSPSVSRMSLVRLGNRMRTWEVEDRPPIFYDDFAEMSEDEVLAQELQPAS